MNRPEKVEEVLFTEAQLKEKVRQLGGELTREYDGKNPLFICLLKGAAVFFSDLIREVECPLEIDFFCASSYSGTKTTGILDFNKCPIPDIKGRDVVLVEDIVDTALTLKKVKEMFLEKEPKSLKIVCLLNKTSAHEGFTVDKSCFEVGNQFVVGYGLDCDQRYRNLPYIGVYKP